MTVTAWIVRCAIAGAIIAILGGCSATSTTSPTAPAICDGIPADMGGCSSARPEFTGSTCQEIAEEWGAAVDRGVLTIIREPPVIDDRQRSARISDVLVLSSIVAGSRLNALGLQAACDVPEFIAAAEPQFSQELMEGLPDALFDGAPRATPDDWDTVLRRAIRIIDEGE